MKILSLESCYKNLKIEKINFDSLTLLVGASGVGKTQILSALNKLTRIANGEGISGFSWAVEFEVNENKYIWSGGFDRVYDDIDNLFSYREEREKASIVKESLIIGNKEVIKRNREGIIYNGTSIVKLSQNESVVSLLREEDDIGIIRENFRKIVAIETIDDKSKSIPLIKDMENVNDVRAAIVNNIYYKLYLCQEKNQKLFCSIKNRYEEIFPLVEDIFIEKEDVVPSHNITLIKLKIKEKGIEEWIPQHEMSSGMLKTLIQIAYIYLSPEGTVFLIDEFENGFGVNCINDVTDIIMETGKGLQFILTSHHPYIINNIPLKNWKIISRNAAMISSNRAEDFNLHESNHEAFTKLINLDIYLEGTRR
ncbi:AAA family ATPase [Xenorhabdus khoisanae]|uniref:AAA family ATPase n=1 Tax=Xenorhabdus khoisanae TaxID=880157 RepID=UPI002358E6ED|nr:AAA family ATPase [Xenorhabdus khoisanae]MDC9614660.1 AAA family ATPase [Xenorhabdus khoisanae]